MTTAPQALDTVIEGDCLAVMPQLDAGSIHAIITSPPYNAGKEYEQDLAFPDWLDLLQQLAINARNLLAPGGYLCLNLPMWMFSRPRQFVPCAAMKVVNDWAPFVDWIHWVKGELDCPEPATTAWGNPTTTPRMRIASEPILVFQKAGPSRPRDLTMDEWAKLTIGVWPIRPQLPYSRSHPATFPEELAERLVRLYSCRGDTVLDPFLGSGTTAVAAKRHGRHWLGIEKEARYCAVAQDRIAAEGAQTGLFPPPSPSL